MCRRRKKGKDQSTKVEGGGEKIGIDHSPQPPVGKGGREGGICPE